MGGRGWLLFLALTILTIHAIGILIFTRGFLLTRTELPHHSHSRDISNSSCFSHPDPNSTHPNHNNTRWTKPAVDRLLIIVLDALRFDFVAPSSCFPETKPWMDKLKVLQRLALTEGSSARIFKAIADPPTTSLQRLKGLTTGGLPTFIDVGNSFGAPAIVEDNLIQQLVENGKRVLMMGDDTWVQLFPNHFNKSYPYPSFNVKDLHTVDNGCIDHLLPSLYEEDWDVLIAHFLGVDHAGHIFGVDSTSMIEKLEQYNAILEKVIEALRSQSGPGGLHENTFLIVMGDHGQTLNGDHGGGSAEEVETSMFAMNFRKPSFSMPSELKNSHSGLNLEEEVCTSSMEQLDFAATVSALLGIPFPYGSIGRVNPQLYALGTGVWNLEGTELEHCDSQSKIEEWMWKYANILCINSWQVKRYVDVYSASSVIGFSSEDLYLVSNLYAHAEEKWLRTTKNLLLNSNENCNASLPLLKMQIDAYSNFLSNVIDLARSKWTEFNLGMMIAGLGIMASSLLIHLLGIGRQHKKIGFSVALFMNCEISFGSIFAVFIVVVRACSFLSNSYILEEGKVANFLLATTGIVKLRRAIAKQKMVVEGIVFLLLISILRFAIEVGLSKQAATSAFLSSSTSWMLWVGPSHPIWIYMTEILPMLALILSAYLLYKSSARSSGNLPKCVLAGTIASYLLIMVHWALESDLHTQFLLPHGFGRNGIPQLVYAIGFGQLLVLALRQLNEESTTGCKRSLVVKTMAVLSACSSTIIILAGKQGSLFALAFIFGAFCIMRLVNIEQCSEGGSSGISAADPLSVTQWSLFAVCLFFSTGHWCAFDGLRYGAAFVGFDEFKLIRQAILLAIDTFGFSHILPVFALPVFVAFQGSSGQTNLENTSLFMQLSQMYMMYGLITAATTTATILCVTIQRRHLMVWGLFAPKFVFDVVGLMLTDVLIVLASLYYFAGIKYDSSERSHKKNSH